MADAVLSAAVDRIFGLLQEQTVYHVNLVRGAEKEVRKLGQELKTIRNVLVDAENRRFQEISINAWLWKLRQTSYEMEDILDEWKYALLKLHKGEHSPHDDDDDVTPPKQKVCSFIPSSSCLCFKKVVVRHQIATKILDVKVELDGIFKESEKYGFKIYEPTAYTLPEFVRDQSTFHINLEEVHGRGTDGNTLVEKIMSNGGSQEELGIHVLSIVGAGGLGKTTLAQMVYNNSRVKGFFDLRIWICVSNPFDRMAIAKGILEHIREGSSRDIEQLSVLLKRVGESIMEKKFLLVLDDVWTEDCENWEFMKKCLGTGGVGSKVLVTTRSERVAETMGKSEKLVPGLLSDDDCWLVLCRKARLEGNNVEEFLDIGKQIAKRCGGLPLAATTLGGILRFKRTLREWEDVLDDEIWGMKEAEDKLFRPLFMSYKELTPTQKQCFSYCAAFPKDFEINVESLIGNWMALGYLGCNDDMELKGKECFDVLAMRSLFQDFMEDDICDEIESCKMHDIVHDFAQYLRKRGKEKAVGVEVAAEMNESAPSQGFDPSQAYNVNEFCTLYCDGDFPPNLCNRAVRLRVLSLAGCKLQGVPHEMDKLIHLRWLDLSENKLSMEDLKFVFQLYFLQTLKLSDCGLEDIPNEIGNLSHLRHLDLSCNNLKELSSEIGNLTELRHLDLGKNLSLKVLPSEIGKLSFLQTIILPGWSTECQIPEALGQLTHLRKLMEFNGTLRLLKNLNQLSVAELYIISSGKDLKGMVEDAREANLSNKKYIECLGLGFEPNIDEEGPSTMDVIDALKPHSNLRILCILNYMGSKLPLWIASPANQLRKVGIWGCDRVTSLPSLGKLPCLEEVSLNCMGALEFVGREFLGTTTNTNFVAFPKLKTLVFTWCDEWKVWEDIRAEEEESPTFQVMPCLTKLEIWNCCNDLTVLPHRLLRKARSLETLYISGSHGLEESYCDEEGSNWKSISLNNPGLRIEK